MFSPAICSPITTIVFIGCLLLASHAVQAIEPKKALIWVANPFNQTRLDLMMADLKTHRGGFTGIAYQYFAVCGQGSNDEGGANDCYASEAQGNPHLAPGHPTNVPSDLGKQLRASLGPEVELWPVISYGNPGNSSVLNRMLGSPDLIAKFSADAIRIAHEQNLTGYNIDFETQGMVGIEAFLTSFAQALQSASPSIGLSYDDVGSTPAGPAPNMTRWVSMGTYTSDLVAFKLGLQTGLKFSGDKFGVGLCPICQTQGQAAAQARFDAINSIGQGRFREIDIWAYGTGGDWPIFWPLMEKWLSSP